MEEVRYWPESLARAGNLQSAALTLFGLATAFPAAADSGGCLLDVITAVGLVPASPPHA
jgi:hypothetical protein